MIDKIEETSKQIVYLTRTIRDTEEQMKAEDDSFLRVLMSFYYFDTFVTLEHKSSHK